MNNRTQLHQLQNGIAQIQAIDARSVFYTINTLLLDLLILIIIGLVVLTA